MFRRSEARVSIRRMSRSTSRKRPITTKKEKVISVRMEESVIERINKVRGETELSRWVGDAAEMRLDTPTDLRIRRVHECMAKEGVTLDMLCKPR